MGRFLGLDSSTQSLSALIIDSDTGQVVVDRTIPFGDCLPQYGSPKGFLPNEDPRIKHSDPLMWVEALDLLLGDLRAAGVDLASVRGVSGAGQQHGSVYLARSLDEAATWTKSAPLRDQVQPLLSRSTAPIWMDSSTTTECAEIARAVGGDARMVALTGSRAIERFTGPQIRKFAKEEPAAWQRTAEVHLVSSFMASLLAGRSAPIDFGDGAGMNLLELATGTWNAKLLEATAPGLGTRLKPPVPSHTVIGTVAPYFVEKHGFAPGTPIVAFTGDNPSSLVGMGATRPGAMVVSLGTSDTVFAAMAAPRTDPRGYGHVFGNPAGGFMALVCFANGSLAREEVARKVGLTSRGARLSSAEPSPSREVRNPSEGSELDCDWEAFARAILEQTAPGNDGNMLLPYFVPEIAPRLPVPAPRWFGSEAFVAGRDPAAAARAVVEAQAVSMRLHSAFIGETTDRVLVTGGASKNRAILRVLADVFQAEIVPLRVSNSSALGGALRAAQAVEGLSWDALYEQFAAPDLARRVTPTSATKMIYDELGRTLTRRIDALVAETGVRR